MLIEGDTAVTARLHAYAETTTKDRLIVTTFATEHPRQRHIAVGLHTPGGLVELHAITPATARILGTALLDVLPR
ncbi:hypothetical protein [Cellulosimicrobium funkei]|uniref:hypothetical protein n=1 Tax=Cellulosimicrobium funkei TaxID=264251 RepID=UPI00343AE794